jgi:hypothetical protein
VTRRWTLSLTATIPPSYVGGYEADAETAAAVQQQTQMRAYCRAYSQSQQAGVGAEKGLEDTVRKDKMLVNETEWPAMVCARMSHGKYQLK